MILALDIGNTNIVLGWIENGNVLGTARFQTRVGETDVEYAIRIKEIAALYAIPLERCDGAILSSVVGPLTEVLHGAVRLLTGLDALIVNVDMDTGLHIAIDEPRTLGADLLVGGVAAAENYGLPAIIVDMGTATTIFAVDSGKNFLGGAIIPGIRLSYAALSSGTSLLPGIGIRAPEKCVSTNTVDCMLSGAVFGSAAMIDGMVERMEEELGETCRIVATGGLASCVMPYCRRKDIILDDELLLKGLWVLYMRNRAAFRERGKVNNE